MAFPQAGALGWRAAELEAAMLLLLVVMTGLKITMMQG